ncbi:MAG: type II CAAX endopeptidase family protein [Gemmatimonadaceae bacterium]
MTTRQTTSPEPASWLYGSGGQLRAAWRIGVFVCVYFLANGIIGAVASPVLSFVSNNTGRLIPQNEWVDLMSALATIAFVLRNVDNQPWSAIGFTKPAWRASLLVQSAVLGGGAIGVTAALLAVSGHLHFMPDTLSAFLSGDVAQSPSSAWVESTVRTTLLLAPAALYEELIFRGYLWRVAEDGSSTRIALVFTSVLFGLVHFQNPGADVLAIANVMLAGLALGLLRMHSDSLPAAWIAHLTWNWVMAALLHVPVSGLPLTTPGYRAIMDGPDWLAGGDWGPEGGAVATLVLLAAVAFGLYPTKFFKSASNSLRSA